MFGAAVTSKPAAVTTSTTRVCIRYTWKLYLPMLASDGWRSTRATPPGAAGLPTVVASSLAYEEACGVQVQQGVPAQQSARRTRVRTTVRAHVAARVPTRLAYRGPPSAAALQGTLPSARRRPQATPPTIRAPSVPPTRKLSPVPTQRRPWWFPGAVRPRQAQARRRRHAARAQRWPRPA